MGMCSGGCLSNGKAISYSCFNHLKSYEHPWTYINIHIDTHSTYIHVHVHPCPYTHLGVFPYYKYTQAHTQQATKLYAFQLQCCIKRRKGGVLPQNHWKLTITSILYSTVINICCGTILNMKWTSSGYRWIKCIHAQLHQFHNYEKSSPLQKNPVCNPTLFIAMLHVC